MNSSNRAPMAAVDRSVRELHEMIDSHRFLMASIVAQQSDGFQMENLACPYVPQSGEGVLKDAIREAIEVLEESRKAFKSKRLEVLRKKLTDVLIDLK
ncbi:MAG: hypothetical protein JRD04_04050 [Deltaproteobacteria bacterium]|nr:hypothetical protein [Deltaproteobacteria bacterium]